MTSLADFDACPLSKGDTFHIANLGACLARDITAEETATASLLTIIQALCAHPLTVAIR
jgi:hypothetical protein